MLVFGRSLPDVLREHIMVPIEQVIPGNGMDMRIHGKRLMVSDYNLFPEELIGVVGYG